MDVSSATDDAFIIQYRAEPRNCFQWRCAECAGQRSVDLPFAPVSLDRISAPKGQKIINDLRRRAPH